MNPLPRSRAKVSWCSWGSGSEIRASIEGVSTVTPVSVEPRPPDRSTLSGSVTDSVSRRGITNAIVQILDGPKRPAKRRMPTRAASTACLRSSRATLLFG